MNRQYDFEDIEDYLSGNMAESDKTAFEAALEEDPELVARLEALRAEAQLSKLLRRQHILDKLKEWDEEEDRQRGGSSADSSRFKYRNWLPYAVAASLMALVAAGIFFSPRDENSVAVSAPVTSPGIPMPSLPADTIPSKETVKPEPTDNNLRDKYEDLSRIAFREDNFELRLMGAGDKNMSAGICKKAAELYGSGDYRGALALLKNPDSDSLTECMYLRGYVLYKMGKYNQAEAVFRKFRKMEFSDRKFDALWGEVFCMTRQLPASRPRLIELLRFMAADQEHPYSVRATQLLTMMGE